MGDDVLSQSEVESLLGATDSTTSDTPFAPTAATPLPAKPVPAAPIATGPPPAVQASPGERVIPYDFKRPERVGKEQMRSLQSLHEDFSRNFSASLSALLRSIVEVKLTNVDQTTYSEFIFSLENPSCLNVLKADPLEGNLILDINPSILYPIIDRLLGGGKESSPVTRRPLTEIELRLVGRITNLFLTELKSAWEQVVTLNLSVERVESNPQLVQIVPPNEVAVLLSFELTIGDIRGMMNLCIPFNSLERIGSKLTADTWVNFGRKDLSEKSEEHIGQQVRGALVELVVQLAETKITSVDLLELRVGDIITTDQDVGSLLPASVEGVPKFRVRPGAVKGQKAFQVQEPIDLSKQATNA